MFIVVKENSETRAKYVFIGRPGRNPRRSIQVRESIDANLPRSMKSRRAQEI